jgi:hypothetical protein
MARLHHHHHSISPDHMPLLHDVQGQENDPERQDEKFSSAENDQISEDGGEKEGGYIDSRWLVGRSGEGLVEDIKPKHQDYHFSALDIRGTKEVSHYYHGSLPLLDVQVRFPVY